MSLAEAEGFQLDDFERFYNQYSRRVRVLVRRRTWDAATVDDLVQETFLRAFRARHRFDPTRPVWPWLAAITANVCNESLRKRRAVEEQWADVDQRVQQRCAPDDDPELRYIGAEQLAALDEALRSLIPRQRRVLEMRALDGRR